MQKRPLLGFKQRMVPIPETLWKLAVSRLAKRARASTRFMTDEHHLVWDFVVLQLPRAEAPLSPEQISAAVGLPVQQVREILDQLERRLTFLFRNAEGAVTWAYPVTLDPTPHRLTFNSGERVNAA